MSSRFDFWTSSFFSCAANRVRASRSPCCWTSSASCTWRRISEANPASSVRARTSRATARSSSFTGRCGRSHVVSWRPRQRKYP